MSALSHSQISGSSSTARSSGVIAPGGAGKLEVPVPYWQGLDAPFGAELRPPHPGHLHIPIVASINPAFKIILTQMGSPTPFGQIISISNPARQPRLADFMGFRV